MASSLGRSPTPTPFPQWQVCSRAFTVSRTFHRLPFFFFSSPSPRTPSLPRPPGRLPLPPSECFLPREGFGRQWPGLPRPPLQDGQNAAPAAVCRGPVHIPPPDPRHTDLLSGLWHCLQILIMALVMFRLALRVNVCLVHQTVSLLRAEVVLTISVTQNCPRADAEELSGECLNTCFPALRNVTRCLT